MENNEIINEKNEYVINRAIDFLSLRLKPYIQKGIYSDSKIDKIKATLRESHTIEESPIKWVRSLKQTPEGVKIKWKESNITQLEKTHDINITQLEKAHDINTHYDNFKPTLDQLTSNQDGVESHLAYSLRSVQDLKAFLTEDMTSLIKIRAEGTEPRELLYSHYSGDLPTTKIREYLNALENMNNSTSKQLLTCSEDLVRNIGKYEELVSKTIVLRGNEQYKKAIDAFSEFLAREAEGRTLETIANMSELNEKFALITMEPLIIAALGNTLFFGLFVSLHKEGIYKCYIKKCVATAAVMQNTFQARITKFYKSIQINTSNPYINTFIQSQLNIVASGSAPTVVGCAYYAYKIYLTRQETPTSEVNQESTLARRLADNFLDGQGLNSPTVDTTRTFASGIAFELGKTLNVISTAFIKGFATQHKDVILEAAKETDRRITSKRGI